MSSQPAFASLTPGPERAPCQPQLQCATRQSAGHYGVSECLHVTDSMTEFIGILIGALIIVVLVRIPRRLIPRHYFEVAELIHGMNNAVTWPAVLIRFSVPLLVSFFTTLIMGGNQASVGSATAFLGAILLIWPSLLDRRLLPWQVVGREIELYVVFGMFVASFASIGFVGGLVASFLEEPLDQVLSGVSLRQALDATSASADELAIAVAGGLIVVALIGGWKLLYRRIQRTPNG